MSKKVQKFLNKEFDNNVWSDYQYTIEEEVRFIKGLTDDQFEIIRFFDDKYENHENIRFNRTTMELEYFDDDD